MITENYLKQGLVIGRFQPITQSHKKLIEKQLQENDIVFVTVIQGKITSQDVQRNPFPQDYRLYLIDKVFQKQINQKKVFSLVQQTGFIPDIINRQEEIQEKQLNKRVYIINVYQGPDRQSDYQKQMKYLYEKNPEHPKVNVKEIQEMDVRQSMVRKQLINNDEEQLKEWIPKEIHNEIKIMLGVVNKLKELYPNQFKKYISEITHLEDQDIDKFIDFLERILYKSDTILQEIKYDGVQNISFTIDENKKLWQGRIQKGKEQKMWKDQNDLPDKPMYNQFRQQITFVKEQYNRYRDVFDKYITDDQLPFSWNNEIISKVYTNIIKFENIEETGRIIILNQFENKLDKKTFEEFIDELQKLPQLKIKVKRCDFDENLNIICKEVDETWKFDKVERINLDKYIGQVRKELEYLLNEIKEFLQQKITIKQQDKNTLTLRIYDILTINLNKVKKEFRDKVKELKEKYDKELRQKFGLIKNILIKYVNEEIEKEKGGYIEGTVIKSQEDQMDVLKIVDKTFFTQLNKQQWSYIESLEKYYKDPKTNETMIGQVMKLRKDIQEQIFKIKLSPSIQNKFQQLYNLNKEKQIQTIVTEIINKNVDDPEKQINTQIQLFKETLNIVEKNYQQFKQDPYRFKQIKSGSGKEVEVDLSHVKPKIEQSIKQLIKNLNDMIQILSDPQKDQQEKLVLLFGWVIKLIDLQVEQE